ncbi:MAG TPA: PaaI family thioesterase [Candidatus Eremiobacteraceae bacterium]|nr:PaaI family thioesterase [Candidatus Eremiobacteraceae bacterium]
MTQARVDPPEHDRLADDRRCFACGPDNPHGIHMVFEYGDATSRCRIEPRPDFGGWSNIMHGGIVATLLDEAMAHAAIAAGVRAVTARIEVRFRKPVPTDRALVVEGKVVGRRGRVLEIEATLSTEAGDVVAQAHSRFVAEPSERAAGG